MNAIGQFLNNRARRDNETWLYMCSLGETRLFVTKGKTIFSSKGICRVSMEKLERFLLQVAWRNLASKEIFLFYLIMMLHTCYPVGTREGLCFIRTIVLTFYALVSLFHDATERPSNIYIVLRPTWGQLLGRSLVGYGRRQTNIIRCLPKLNSVCHWQQRKEAWGPFSALEFWQVGSLGGSVQTSGWRLTRQPGLPDSLCDMSLYASCTQVAFSFGIQPHVQLVPSWPSYRSSCPSNHSNCDKPTQTVADTLKRSAFTARYQRLCVTTLYNSICYRRLFPRLCRIFALFSILLYPHPHPHPLVLGRTCMNAFARASIATISSLYRTNCHYHRCH